VIIAFFLSTQSLNKTILAIMIALWSLRLGGFLFIRIQKMKKDKRFDGMRESFTKFIKFWLLQGLTVWIILIPTILFLATNRDEVIIIGAIIWLIGLIIETIADAQKYKFKQNKKNKDKFIQEGIWKYSRHPNYFGEILCWIGIYIYVFPALTITNKIIGLISPIFIIALLMFVSGVPLLEKYADKKWGHQKDYKEYKRKTSLLIPLPQKK
jgi:steroid 5-alpha reductase family enzyme